MSLGSRIRELRKEQGWSQDEFAFHAEIDGRQVSRYENDKVVPSVAVIVKIATAFDVSADYLLFDEAPRRPLQVEDSEILSRLHAIQALTDEDRSSLFHILDALIAKNRIKSLATEIA